MPVEAIVGALRRAARRARRRCSPGSRRGLAATCPRLPRLDGGRRRPAPGPDRRADDGQRAEGSSPPLAVMPEEGAASAHARRFRRPRWSSRQRGAARRRSSTGAGGTAATAMEDMLAASDPRRPMHWVVNTLPARTLATTRLAEAWIHTNDVAGALASTCTGRAAVAHRPPRLADDPATPSPVPACPPRPARWPPRLAAPDGSAPGTSNPTTRPPRSSPARRSISA